VVGAAVKDAVDEELLRRNVAWLVQLRVTDERMVPPTSQLMPFAMGIVSAQRSQPPQVGRVTIT
jgi:hypothetical protein